MNTAYRLIQLCSDPQSIVEPVPRLKIENNGKIKKDFTDTYTKYERLDPSSGQARKLRRYFRQRGTSIKQLRKDNS